MPNINFAAVKVDRGDQPIFVSGNIENKQIVYAVCRWKYVAKFRKTMEICFLYNLIPSCKRWFAIWVFFPKLNKCFAGDDMHKKSLSQNEILSNPMPIFD